MAMAVQQALSGLRNERQGKLPGCGLGREELLDQDGFGRNGVRFFPSPSAVISSRKVNRQLG